jgi:hypothetical protein
MFPPPKEPIAMDAQSNLAVWRPHPRGVARPITRSVLAAVTVAVTIILSGCGSGPSASAQVTSAIKAYLKDVANGNGSAACKQLSTSAAQRLVQAAARFGVKSCPQAVDGAAKQLTQATRQTLLNAKVTHVRISGTNATANVSESTEASYLMKIGGRWLISGGLT